MLHDIGLTPAYGLGQDPGLGLRNARADAPCFAIRGAGVAETIPAVAAWSPERRRRLTEAIAMHLNVRVSPSHCVEGYLLNAGSAFDVAGIRFAEIPQELTRTIEERWQQNSESAEQIARLWMSEANAERACRGAFLNAWASFERRMRESRPPGWYELGHNGDV